MPSAEATGVTLDRGALRQANDASQALAAAAAEAADSAELHKLVGRIEAAHFIETVSAKMIAETYSKAKAVLGSLGEVTVRDKTGSLKRVSDMDTFCDLAMPVSARRCRQIVASIETLGSALYDQSERIGFRARDYLSLKALPADDQAVVKQALADGSSREQVLDLLSELAERNTALRRRNDDLVKKVEVKDKVAAAKEAKITEQQEEIARLTDGLANRSEAEQLELVRNAALAAEMALRCLVHDAGQVLDSPATEVAATGARQGVEFVAQLFATLISEANMVVDFTEMVTPTWLNGGRA